MILSIGVIERRFASEDKSEMEFEFRVKVVIEINCCFSSSARVPPSV